MRTSEPSRTGKVDVCVVGMGYVGLTLALVLADAGFQVIGCETNADTCRLLNAGRPHLFENGVAEALQRHAGRSLKVMTGPPDVLPPAVIVCVGTPLDPV